MTGMTTARRKVTDLPLAAFLALRHRLIRVEGNGGGKCAFVFEDTEAVEQDCMAFLSRRTTVEPMAYAENIRTLRRAIQ